MSGLRTSLIASTVTPSGHSDPPIPRHPEVPHDVLDIHNRRSSTRIPIEKMRGKG